MPFNSRERSKSSVKALEEAAPRNASRRGAPACLTPCGPEEQSRNTLFLPAPLWPAPLGMQPRLPFARPITHAFYSIGPYKVKNRLRKDKHLKVL